MNKNLAFIFLLSLGACKHGSFDVKDLSKEQKSIKQERFKRLASLDEELRESLKAHYKKANSPTFALIKGYYHLPSTRPFGSVEIIESYSYQTKTNYLKLISKNNNYAISPMNADEALGLIEAINSLLDMGIKISELSMADALKVAEVEKSLDLSKDHLHFNKVLNPGADFLVSIDLADSKNGPVFVGRVINKNGQLMAFRAVRSSDYRMLSEFVISLFEDTIKRLNL